MSTLGPPPRARGRRALLAAGLVRAAYTGSAQLAASFLGCVVVAGVVGGLTVERAILFVQALPAAVVPALAS